MKQKNGQVLLIVVMLMATVITVVLSMSFQSTTDTKLAKLEEDSQRALAAAEAGIEAAIKEKANVSFGAGSLTNISGFTGGATITSLATEEFVTPLLQKDEQYTFYLSTPAGNPPNDPDFTTITPAYNNKDLTVCFGAASSQTAIEIAILKQSNKIKRYVINPVEGVVVSNALSGSAVNSTDCPNNDPAFSSKYIISSADLSTNSLLLMVRVVNTNQKSYGVGFRAVSGTNFPLQGKTISSQATSTTGISKKVQLFQSYPQIPSDFFITNFNL